MTKDKLRVLIRELENRVRGLNDENKQLKQKVADLENEPRAAPKSSYPD